MKTRAHYLLIDGYNVIHARPELSAIAEDSLEGARNKLCDILSEFMALSGYRIIVVFDAHMVPGGIGSVSQHNSVKIVFTKEAETADRYIEQAAYKLSKEGRMRDRITVATSDALEQLIILGQGAGRISSADLWTEIDGTKKRLRQRHIENTPIKKNPLFDLLDKETAAKLDAMRYGK
ncbi:MAG: NYN domain-containing protein [Defluviitaleaceae bacterium]|nr:NYN domain-containing protein [Defluviitaleaceae bacterium]